MKLPTLALLALPVLLAACHAERRSAITVEVTGDGTHGTASMTCRASTSGMCHAVFLSGGITKKLDAATAATAIADGLAPGTRFCVETSAPDPASCKSTDLADGRQIVRHERRETD